MESSIIQEAAEHEHAWDVTELTAGCNLREIVPLRKRGKRVALNPEQESWMEQLYGEVYSSLLIYAQCALKDDPLAEEAVQDAFRIACSSIEELMRSANPAGWLMNALKNVIQNVRRRRARLNKLVVTAFSVEQVTVPPQTGGVELALACEQALGEDEYKLLKMVAIDHHTMLEAANEFGISVETCRKRLLRVKKKLKKALEIEN